MASKLTPEQKAANKDAVNARSRAFHARRRDYTKAVEAARAQVEAGPETAAWQQAAAAREAGVAARDAALKAIDDQIAELQRQRKAAEGLHSLRLSELVQAANAAWEAKAAVQRKAEAAVDAQYPDVAHCYSSAAWKPLEEFLPTSEVK